MLEFIRSDLSEFKAYTPHPTGVPGHTESAAPLQYDQLDTNENPYDLPEDLKQKLTWHYTQAIRANRYPDGGHGQLKQAIADYVNESINADLPNISPTQISVGNGSDELIRSLLIATCLRGEGSILVADPTFSMYGILAETLGIPVVRVGRSSATFEMDLVAAEATIARSQHPPVRVVFVVHPNSPTANALTDHELAWLRSLPANILVVIDEAYFEFSQTSVVTELCQRPNWVVLRTFSKAFRLAAHRVGYAVAHSDLITILDKVRLPYNLPSFSQAAALVALQNRSSLLPIVTQLLQERDRLFQALTTLPDLQVWPSDANFLFMRLRQPANPDVITQLHAQLKAEGTLVRLIANGFRVTVGTPEENGRTIDRLKTGLNQAANC